MPNPEGALAPGMFARVEVTARSVEDALVVPYAALTRRAEREGVFIVAEGKARFIEVRPGIRDGERLEILEPELEGPVVTLGQQLLDDGSAVVVPKPQGSPPTR